MIDESFPTFDTDCDIITISNVNMRFTEGLLFQLTIASDKIVIISNLTISIIDTYVGSNLKSVKLSDGVSLEISFGDQLFI